MTFTLAAATKVWSYGIIKPGPEAKLMRSLKTWALSGEEHEPHWAATGFPIGGGEPDLVLVSCSAQLRALRHMTTTHARLLAYLAEMTSARPSTIARRSGAGSVEVEEALDDLVAIGAVRVRARSMTIVPSWRQVLSDTVAIEAKVSDWRRGATQAARNRVFAQRSFLALPQKVAERVSEDPLIETLGIGILGVDADCVSLVREAPREDPLIWFYYYWLAVAVAGSLRGRSNVRHSDR